MPDLGRTARSTSGVVLTDAEMVALGEKLVEAARDYAERPSVRRRLLVAIAEWDDAMVDRFEHFMSGVEEKEPRNMTGNIPVGERSVGGREYVLAFGPADPEAKKGYVQVSVHQCPECAALVVEDFMPEHERWHAEMKALR